MKFQLISDVHCEFYKDSGYRVCEQIEPMADTLVIAGDFHQLCFTDSYVERLQQLKTKFRDIVWVLGNHDYWGGKAAGGLRLAECVAASIDGVHLLEASLVEIAGVQFGGGTLWYHRNSRFHGAAPCVPDNQHLFQDNRHIEGIAPFVWDQFDAMCALLSEEAPDVVVTHHQSSEWFISPRFRFDAANPFFCSPIDALISNSKVAVCGHTHDCYRGANEYGTALHCNPFGYPGEVGNKTWENKFSYVVEV